MIDLDGTSVLSKIIAVNFDKINEFFILENPANNGEFTINTNLKDARFTLLNSLGTKINVEIKAESKNTYRLHTQAPAGVYYLNIESNGRFITRKIVIQ
jgi:phage-related protein